MFLANRMLSSLGSKQRFPPQPLPKGSWIEIHKPLHSVHMGPMFGGAARTVAQPRPPGAVCVLWLLPWFQ